MHRLTVAEAAAAVRERRASPSELTEAVLARAAWVNDTLGAYCAWDETARAEAAVLTQEAAGGVLRGVLHGVPVAVKDVIDVRGLPTCAGSGVPDGVPAEADAPVVRRLREAGAIVVGKTATHPFAIGVTTRATVNPWDPARLAGGSSGGSAVAVASGAAPGALGTDTAGSIRIPAALCGVSGLKPARAALPMEGIVPLAPSMDTCGPIAGTAADLDLMWQALSGAKPARPHATVRLGVPRGWEAEADPGVVAAVEAAIAVLCEAGARPVEVELPPFSDWDRPRGTLLVAEALEGHRAAGWWPARADGYDAESAEYMRRAELVPEEDLRALASDLDALTERFAHALDGVDVLVLPTTPVCAPLRDGEGDVARRDARHARVLARFCGPANATGLPAVSIPCGHPDGLPAGLQLVARTEEDALSVALAFQRLTDHHLRRP